MPEMIDMHCHIIPGVDDGARTKKDVRELLLMEYKSGVRHIVIDNRIIGKGCLSQLSNL